MRLVSPGLIVTIGFLAMATTARAQALVDPDLTVTTVASGLSQPIAMAFIEPDDILVNEQASQNDRHNVANPAGATG